MVVALGGSGFGAVTGRVSVRTERNQQNVRRFRITNWVCRLAGFQRCRMAPLRLRSFPDGRPVGYMYAFRGNCVTVIARHVGNNMKNVSSEAADVKPYHFWKQHVPQNGTVLVLHQSR